MHPTGKEIYQRSILVPIIGGIVECAILEAVLACCTRCAGRRRDPVGDADHDRGGVEHRLREQLEIARQQMLEGSGFTQQPLIETELFPGAAAGCSKSVRRPERSTSSSRVAGEYFNRELEYRIKTFHDAVQAGHDPLRRRLVVGFVMIALVSAMYGVLGGVQDASVIEACHTRSTPHWPMNTASTVPAARNGPKGSAVRRPPCRTRHRGHPHHGAQQEPEEQPDRHDARRFQVAHVQAEQRCEAHVAVAHAASSSGRAGRYRP
ncbi:MAG: hypothetical protein R2705_24880 [Ilumatobacteraceae bacterium]